MSAGVWETMSHSMHNITLYLLEHNLHITGNAKCWQIKQIYSNFHSLLLEIQSGTAILKDSMAAS